MTGLLSRDASAGAGAQRPPAVTAAMGAVFAAGAGLVVCVGVAVLGWLAGSGGTLADAARAGASAWLLAHGAGLEVGSATITLIPLGLTALVVCTIWCLSRWVGRSAGVDDLRTLATATATIAGCYAALATITAVVAATDTVESSPVRALVGSLVVAGAAGAAGMASAADLVRPIVAECPDWVGAVTRGSAAVVATLFAAGALLTTVSLVSDLDQAATVAASLEAGALGGAVFTTVQILLLPNAALLAVSYLIGPGFVLGTDTVVAPTGVVLGQIPAVPLLAALPIDGAAPWWAMGMLAAPVLAGMVGAVVALRVDPVQSVLVGMTLGAVAGSVGGAAAGLLTTLGGGAAGPGRMAEVGSLVWQCMGSGAVAAGSGGVLAAAVCVWRSRRRS